VHQLVNNIYRDDKDRRRQLIKMAIAPNDLLELSADITSRFLELHGAELYPHNTFLQKPVDVINGQESWAHTLPLKQILVVGDLLDIDIIVLELYAELKHDYKRYVDKFNIHPYILFKLSKTVDPYSFKPIIRFQTSHSLTAK